MKPLLKRHRVQRRTLQQWLINPATLTLVSIVVVVVLFMLDTPALDTIELNWLDLRFRTRGPLKPEPAVVLAAIDERSLSVEGKWPWPRSRPPWSWSARARPR